MQQRTSFASGAEALIEILYRWPDTDAIFSLMMTLQRGQLWNVPVEILKLVRS